MRKANLTRCEAHFHPLNSWSETDWGCALAGEVGELCNFLKKRKRTVDAVESHKISQIQGTRKLISLHNSCKKEIGDVLSYLDLISASMGLTLEECIRDKFNEVSDRVKSKIKL